MPASKHGEFERQLKGQQDGLNRLTVEEFLENVVNPKERDPKVARNARRKLYDDLRRRAYDELSKGMSRVEAKKLSAKQAKETMSSLAALHNPDLIAGGRDVIADFGDRQVNSTIGPQWKSRVGELIQSVKKQSKEDGVSGFLNVRLHKC
ncbi:hypothetical protein KMS_R07710 [Pseudomonas sp. LRP2-20]|nr:hypothetical protein KMS_R07710 [Pseudomonas sp. LRP2-20]